jgi:flagellin-like hook-associated protein FlgL
LANEQSATGPYAAEIPFQQAAVPTLARQTGLLAAAGKATDRIDVLNGTLASAIAEAQDPATTAARKTELKTIFQTTVNEINQLVSEATYNGENLIDGSIAGQISVQISSGGQSTVVNGRNLSTGFLDNLAAANAAFQADDFAGADTGYDSASTVFGAVRTGLTQDSNAFNESIATVQRWVPTLATANLYNASEAVNKAQAATTSASGLIAQIRTLAAQASDAGLDATTRANLNTQYLALRDQLRDAIAGASQAGSSLLDGSTVSIGAGAGANEVVIDGSGTVLKIGGENLKQFADDTTLPPDSLYNLDLTTAAGAASIVGKVDNTIDPAISKAFRTLATYDAIYDFTANTLDPRGAIDRDYRKLSADLDGLIKGAKSGNNNLLEPTAADIIVRSAVTGATVTARAYTTFRSLVESSLLTGKDQLPTDFSAARRALDDAAFFARQVQTNLNTDRVVFKSQLERVTQAKTEAQKNEPTKETNAYIRSFIEKYLLKKDAEAAKSGFNVGSGGNAYVLNLLT